IHFEADQLRRQSVQISRYSFRRSQFDLDILAFNVANLPKAFFEQAPERLLIRNNQNTNFWLRGPLGTGRTGTSQSATEQSNELTPPHAKPPIYANARVSEG